jgi:hypothetical protein
MVFVFLAGALWIGCSDSTPPTTNYPLTLTVDSSNQVTGYSALDFSLRVTENGVPVTGATLVQSDELPISPYISVFNQGISNGTGTFPSFFIYYDTVTEVSFQAFKDTVINNVKDTLWSNQKLVVLP